MGRHRASGKKLRHRDLCVGQRPPAPQAQCLRATTNAAVGVREPTEFAGSTRSRPGPRPVGRTRRSSLPVRAPRRRAHLAAVLCRSDASDARQ